MKTTVLAWLLILVLYSGAFAEKSKISTEGQSGQCENAVAQRLDYLNDISQIKWARVVCLADRTLVFVGWKGKPEGFRMSANSVALWAHKTSGKKAFAYHFDAFKYKKYTESMAQNYFCFAPAYDGKVQKSNCR